METEVEDQKALIARAEEAVLEINAATAELEKKKNEVRDVQRASVHVCTHVTHVGMYMFSIRVCIQ